MEYIALEECFAIPELAVRRSDALSGIRLRRSYMSDVHSRLSDFTEYRLPEMDEYSIAVQVLSWVTPGTQYPDLSPQEAIDDARYANDYLASVVAANPDRFRGFAAPRRPALAPHRVESKWKTLSAITCTTCASGVVGQP
jgi:2,3-dihydroxybenzoate decarboxylase